ncbi:shikimate dehydrogenase [Bacillus massiliigorillae]|uniref:shikimate dehydrogenase n=1 Tax=Bacillus massiliigorillae TaxID=1243664 RepID=UPI0005AA8F08|nr:shikimate dehydrogenase [Bacillus massiliigorillae]
MKQIYGVIGDPISHSMSPDMHNDAFTDQELEAYYNAFHVRPDHLEDAVKGMKAIGVKGFNITVPHKTAIIPFLDQVDELAAAIGAVNTVKYENGQFIGYNTDGLGFVAGLKEELHESLIEKRTLIIGAGGAARGIYYSLVSEGIREIDIANRTVSRAQQIIIENPYEAKSNSLTIQAAAERLNEYDLIINTTSIGMKPNVDEMPISLQHLRNDAFVSDIIYNPLETKFLSEAKKKGASIQNGLPMFIHQGALAFRIWTGVEPNIERMKAIVLKKLGG